MEKLVSIIVPFYNRKNLIEETLDSILKQSYSNWECILIDDGSTDEAPQIVQEWAKKDQRIKYYHRNRNPKGAPVCRNIGIEKSKGEYLIFFDSDDIMAPWCLEQRVKEFSKHPDLDFIGFPTLCFEKKPADSRILWNIFTPENDLTKFLNNDSPWHTAGPIWKKKSILNLGYWDEDALDWQDWEYSIRALIIFNKNYKTIITLPDNFLRRDDNIARISNRGLDEDGILSKYNLFTKIIKLLEKTHHLSEERRLNLSRVIFQYSESLVFNSKNINPTGFLKIIKERSLINKIDYLKIKIYIVIINFTHKRVKVLSKRILFKIIKIILLPQSHLEESTKSKCKVSISAEDLNTLRKRLKVLQ